MNAKKMPERLTESYELIDHIAQYTAWHGIIPYYITALTQT